MTALTSSVCVSKVVQVRLLAKCSGVLRLDGLEKTTATCDKTAAMATTLAMSFMFDRR